MNHAFIISGSQRQCDGVLELHAHIAEEGDRRAVIAQELQERRSIVGVWCGLTLREARALDDATGDEVIPDDADLAPLEDLSHGDRMQKLFVKMMRHVRDTVRLQLAEERGEL